VLTRQGWIVILIAVGVLIAARAFGIIELYVVGAVLVILPLAALVYVRAARVRLRVSRSLSPTRVHAGDATRVELGATNLGTRRTPVLQLRDPVGGTRGALLHLAPLKPGESARAAYRLPTTRRGIIAVGPLGLEVGDPFGLAVQAAEAAPVLELTVYPRVDPVAAPKEGGDRDPHGAASNLNVLGQQGDDFYALREYVVGDDLRRVHWPSTARRDELMVRHEEMPWQDRTTVVLDVRRASHTAASLERAVSAAASVITATGREQHLTRFLASDGVDSNLGAGMVHNEAILEYLARLEVVGHGSLRQVLDILTRSPQGGVLVAVLGRATPGELDTLTRLHRAFRTVIAVVCEPPMPAPTVLQGRLIRVDASRDGTFAPAWSSSVRSNRTEIPA
jgi:uncharacterized protein (DUF58 family)